MAHVICGVGPMVGGLGGHLVSKLMLLLFFLIMENTRNIKLITLTVFTCTTQWL